MVLLHLLREQAGAADGRLVVAHFNHRLRGRAGDADEALVRRTARGLGLPCVVGSADVRREAARRGVSLEMAARELRHAFLAKVAQQRGASVIALAHHADDQVELFFLRLLRGAGGEGLGGMKALSPSPANPRVRLWRPLLEFTKAELRALARTRGIRFREDASNASPAHRRNRVRGELLPLLRQLEPGFAATVARVMAITGAEAELADALAGRWLNARRRGAFARLPVAVQRHALRRQLLALGVPPDFELIETLRGCAGKRVSVAAGRWLVRGTSGVVGWAANPQPTFGADEVSIALSPGSQRWRVKPFTGGVLRWRVIPRPANFRPGADRAGAEFFDADQIGPRLTLRHWRAGDRFQPIGMNGSVKLQDWFTNRKVPATERRQRVLGVTAAGDIFWVEGERISERAKVSPQTRRLLEWRWGRTAMTRRLPRPRPAPKLRA